MKVELLADDADYYVRLAGSGGALRWYRHDDGWASCSASVPPGLRVVDFDALPADLREEVLAFLARAEALGNRAWSGS